VIERDPITTAKEVASLDHLSNGRFLFGIGAGWNKEEMGNHGTAYATRYRLLKERVLAMKAIWTQDEASYRGEFVNFGPMLSYPKPVQKPHPPIFLGGNGPKALEAVADYCDGWFPLGFFKTDFAADIARLREKRPMEVSLFGVKPDEKTVEQLAQAGVSRAIFRVPPAPADKVLPMLDRFAALVHT
jgi:probable F420-dependent oxidoreductase